MNIHHHGSGKSLFRRTMSLLLSAAVFFATFAVGGLITEADAQTSAPSASCIYAYGTDPSAVYITTSQEGNDKNATYRVYIDDYDYTTGTYFKNKLGETYWNVSERSYCVITLPEKMVGAYIYVTRQEDGLEESDYTGVSVSKTPAVSLLLREVQKSKQTEEIPTTQYNLNLWCGNFVLSGGSSITKTITKDNYYMVEVRLDRFLALNAVYLPLRYDTEILEPASIRISSSKYYLQEPNSTALENAANGINFDIPSQQAANYGVLEGFGIAAWSYGSQYPSGYFGSSSGAYQSLNSTTGLYKVQGSVHTMNPSPAPFGQKDTENQFIRIFFRAKQTLTVTQLPVWFATEADCPEALLGTAAAEQYYDPIYPNGLAPILFSANVLTPPPMLETVSTDTSNVVNLSAAEATAAMPSAYYSKVTTFAALDPNQVKVYNYTNYPPLGDASLVNTRLDGTLNDKLVIPAGSTGLRAGYSVRVYKDPFNGYSDTYKEAEYSSNDGVTVDLGTDFLDAAGGKLYVVVDNTVGLSTPADCTVTYPPEMTRDVTFRIYRTGWEGSGWESGTITPMEYTYSQTAGENALHTGTPLSEENYLRFGEHLQIRIYFDNFYELMSYGFNLRFDPSKVQVADIDYNPLSSGTVTEAQFREEQSCFTVGRDLANITFSEQLIYQAWESGDEDQIADLMTQYDLTRAEFDQKAQDVQVKYDNGVTMNGPGELPWKGGLIFTNRGNESDFPYVDNENGTVRFVSASLQQTPMTLQRGNGGYHFITINFVSVGLGDPGFRLAETGESGYDALPGQQIALVGEETGMKVTQHWEVWPMGNTVEIGLRNGNATLADGEETAVYLFAGEPYRDPGYEVRRADGSRIDIADISRYYEGDEGRVDLIYASDERIMDFVVPDGAYSAQYTLYYEYETSDGQQSVSTERNIYIIYKKGDVNRDGLIDLFDEQALLDYENGVASPCDSNGNASYWMYKRKTADLSGDGSINFRDRNILHEHNMSCALIEQDYVMPVS